MKANEFLEQGIAEMKDREAAYDAPGGERSMARTVAAFNAFTGRGLTEAEGWLFMQCLKVSRSLQGDFKADNHVDGAAYEALRGECVSTATPELTVCVNLKCAIALQIGTPVCPACRTEQVPPSPTHHEHGGLTEVLPHDGERPKVPGEIKVGVCTVQGCESPAVWGGPFCDKGSHDPSRMDPVGHANDWERPCVVPECDSPAFGGSPYCAKGLHA